MGLYDQAAKAVGSAAVGSVGAGLRTVGRAGVAVAAAPVSAGRRMLAARGLGSAPAAAGLTERGLNYGARHVMSGTLPGAIALGNNVPITRRLADGASVVRGNAEQMQAAREGVGVKDPNALSEVQMKRMGIKQAADEARRASPAGSLSSAAAQHGEVLQVAENSGIVDLDKQAFMAEALGGALAATAVGAGAGILRDAWTHHKANSVYEGLKGYGTKRDRENYEVIKEYAPALAMNPTVLRSQLERMRHMDIVPHELVDDFAGTQGKVDQNSLAMEGLRGGLRASAGLAGARVGKDRAEAASAASSAASAAAKEKAEREAAAAATVASAVSSPASLSSLSLNASPRTAGGPPGGFSPAAPGYARPARPDARKRAELDPAMSALESEFDAIDKLLGR